MLLPVHLEIDTSEHFEYIHLTLVYWPLLVSKAKSIYVTELLYCISRVYKSCVYNILI